MNNQNDHDTYIIPPNFVETGTFFGGMFKARNVIEASVLAFAIGLPVFLFLPLGLTARIIVLCLTALPLALLALIGISGESLSSFLVIFLKFLKNRRIVGGEPAGETAYPGLAGRGRVKRKEPAKEKKTVNEKRAANVTKPAKVKRGRTRRPRTDADFPAEFDEIREYEIRQKLRPCKGTRRERSGNRTAKWREKPGKASVLEQQETQSMSGKAQAAEKVNSGKNQTNGRGKARTKKAARTQEPAYSYINPAAGYFPITKI